MNTLPTKQPISRTECVRIEGMDSLLIHVSVKFTHSKQKKARRGKVPSGKLTYTLVVRQSGRDLFEDSWTNAIKFPLQAMKDELATSPHTVITDHPDAIATGLKSVRKQIEAAQRTSRGG